MRLNSRVLGLAAIVCLATLPVSAQSPLDPPGATVSAEARSIVQRMIGNPRGPYSRIRWFCNDGIVLPPEPFACREHGGGRQHAEYSADRERLAALGWSVGTILAALTFSELSDDSNRRSRLRELSLEAYMVDIDDGWVLRQARGYRGRVQIEAEEAAGQGFLVELFRDGEWVADNFLLAREVTRVLPHGGGAEDLARTVRRDAIELAGLDASFQSLRAEIHGNPDATTAVRVRAWSELHTGDFADAAMSLADALDRMYGSAGRRERLENYRARLARRSATAELAVELDIGTGVPAVARLRQLARVAQAARDAIESPTAQPVVRIELFDLLADLEAELFVTAYEALEETGMTRRELIELATDMIAASYGTGLLTTGERDTLLAETNVPESLDDLSISDFAKLVEMLRRLPQWAAGTIRYSFAEPLVRYTALDPRAAQFTDDLLRGSTIAGISEVTRRLAIDLAVQTGVTQSINGTGGVSAFGLNPGVAEGMLRIRASEASLEETPPDRSDIVVIPETTPELPPVAGIITLGEGNPLSHVQLLARNFGIPNIAVAPGILSVVEPLRDRRVVAAVSTNGSLVLTAYESVPAELRELLIPANIRGAELTVPPVDLDPRDPIPLSGLRSSLSGRVVGPKAANLGELARLFPGRVAPAVAIPFGIFAEQVGGDAQSPRIRLTAVYAAHREGRLSDTELETELADIRSAIAATQISPVLRASLRTAMAQEFGLADSYGVFVRSDTNVEDLPEFTGAGLSETLPNVTGTDAIIDSIPRVWASVLSPRAIAWRSSLLTNPDQVFASVLLMQSVPSDKSGVMVTTNVSGSMPGLTVSAAWGVGGGVGGESTETVVLHPNGSETLVSEAKAAYARRLAETGGLAMVPASDGPVLTPGDKLALRALADTVAERYDPVLDANGRPRPWDIEYGFVDDELTLFQIRPLVERGPQLANRFVETLSSEMDSIAAAEVVALDVPPGTTSRNGSAEQ